MGGMGRIEARVAEVAGEVGAHEVDREDAQIGLELEARPAGVADLVDVLDERGGVAAEVLPPALLHGVVGRDEAGDALVDRARRTLREDLRPLRPPVPRDDDPVERLRRIRERHRDERRAHPAGARGAATAARPTGWQRSRPASGRGWDWTRS